MPRRALRCMVDLTLHAISAPGVWLPSKEDVYLSVSLFSQYRNTRLLTSIFPLLMNERFRFEKTYYTAVDPSQVAEMLEDELVIFELVQLSEYTDGAVRLASYSTNARDFLYPYPTLAPSYSSHDREVLMCRTIAFPGISPKLEFTTKTVIKESISPELDAFDDAVEMERESYQLRKTYRRPRSRQEDSEDSDYECGSVHSRGRQRKRALSAEDGCPPHYTMPTVTSLSRSRSPSPSVRRKLADISLGDTIDPRPPFVVRKLDTDLIGRTPSGSSTKGAQTKKKRSASPYRSPSRTALDDSCLSYTSKPGYRLTKVIREPFEDPLPVFKPRYRSKYDDDIDNEVAQLTATKSLLVTPRPRSVSPILYRTTLKDRYGLPLYTRPFTPTYYDLLTEKELELARARRLARVYGTYNRSLDDLELELRLARIRAGTYY